MTQIQLFKLDNNKYIYLDDSYKWTKLQDLGWHTIYKREYYLALALEKNTKPMCCLSSINRDKRETFEYYFLSGLLFLKY